VFSLTVAAVTFGVIFLAELPDKTALAGLMLGARIGVINADIGYTSGYELEAIAAAVIGGALIGGGVGRIAGVILGVAVLTVLATGLDIVGVSDFRQKMVTGAVLLGAVLVSRARGLRPEQVRRTLEHARWRVSGPQNVPGRRPAS